MKTLQGMRMNSNYIAETIRQAAITETFEKWQAAVREYYTKGYDNGETTQYYMQLEKLGANMECLIDEDFKIREEILGY